jgi:hypothetical protein
VISSKSMSVVYGHGSYMGIRPPSSIGEITRMGKYRLCAVDGKVFEVTSGRFKVGDYYCISFNCVDCAFYPAKIIGVFTLCDQTGMETGTATAALLQNGVFKIFPGKQYLPIQPLCDGILRVGEYYYYEEFSKEIPYDTHMEFKVDGRCIYRRFERTISDAYGGHAKMINGNAGIDRWNAGCIIYNIYGGSSSAPCANWYFDTLPIIAPSKVFNDFSLVKSAEEIIDDTEVKLKNESSKIRVEYHEVITQICVDAVVSSAEKLSQKIAIESNLESELCRIKEELAAAKSCLAEHAKRMECAICFKETKKRTVYSCGHMDVCQSCDGNQIKDCPICKVPIMLRFKVIAP